MLNLHVEMAVVVFGGALLPHKWISHGVEGQFSRLGYLGIHVSIELSHKTVSLLGSYKPAHRFQTGVDKNVAR